MTPLPNRTHRRATLTPSFSRPSKKFAAFALAGAAAALGSTAAHATNEHTQLFATTCSPYVIGGCAEASSQVGLAYGLNVGGGYAFASGYRGGDVLTSAVFAPGAGPTLQGGIYKNGSVADYTYSFQVQGAPNTLVPLHIYGLVSSSAIHLSDGGQPVHLVDGPSDSAPTTQWNAVAAAYLHVIPVRLTPYPVSTGAASLQTSYQVGPAGNSFCQNCGGGSSALNESIWVWSNSDINVQLDASVLLEYNALGSGGDNVNTFGDLSIEIDPTFSIDDPAYSSFQVVGVPTGFAPPLAAAVPEPESWAMLLGGLGLVGGAMRGRKRT